jgi:outer membrane protein assembly factor BamA
MATLAHALPPARTPFPGRGTMLRSLLGLLLLAALCVPGAASAQNPFLQNQGKRTIQAIEFDGHERTKLYVLERELGFRVGDEFDPVELNDAWARLEQLPFIAYVEIETNRPGPGLVELDIHVEEEGIFRWQLGLDYSRRVDPKWYGDLRLRLENTLGRADVLELQLNAWALNQARLRWSNPWILGPTRLGIYADVGAFEHDWVYAPAPDARNREFAVEAGLAREFHPGFHASVAGRWRKASLDDIPDGDVQPAFGPGTPIDGSEVSVDEGAVLVSAGFDNRDSRYYPGRGINARADFVYGAPSGAFEDWNTLDLTLGAFVPVPLLTTLGGFVTHRTASTSLPWYERTYFGGPDDLRGIAFASRRGDEHLRASVEIRRPLFVVPLRAGRSIGLGLHAFSDWGAAWEYDQSISDQRFDNSFGLGAHFNFNTYNYRFEWAVHDGESFFVFEDHFTF